MLSSFRCRASLCLTSVLLFGATHTVADDPPSQSHEHVECIYVLIHPEAQPDRAEWIALCQVDDDQHPMPGDADLSTVMSSRTILVFSDSDAVAPVVVPLLITP